MRILPTIDSRALITRLETDGWGLGGSLGSHDVFLHPTKQGHLSGPLPWSYLGTGLLHKLLRQAGLG